VLVIILQMIAFMLQAIAIVPKVMVIFLQMTAFILQMIAIVLQVLVFILQALAIILQVIVIMQQAMAIILQMIAFMLHTKGGTNSLRLSYRYHIFVTATHAATITNTARSTAIAPLL
jgi:hypothetical protein